MFQFDLDGGRVCLDFANTLSQRSGDHIATYADLLAFADQTHALTRDQLRRLHALADAQPEAAEAVVRAARQLRAALYAVFSAVAAERQPAAADLQVLNVALGRALGHARVEVVEDGGFGWTWDFEEATLEAPLWSIVRSAADLLTSSAELRAVRECGAADCAWLFMDTSKNRSRQWCSMQSCGNREKARRHYLRVRATRARR